MLPPQFHDRLQADTPIQVPVKVDEGKAGIDHGGIRHSRSARDSIGEVQALNRSIALLYSLLFVPRQTVARCAKVDPEVP